MKKNKLMLFALLSAVFATESYAMQKKLNLDDIFANEANLKTYQEQQTKQQSNKQVPQQSQMNQKQSQQTTPQPTASGTLFVNQLPNLAPQPPATNVKQAVNQSANQGGIDYEGWSKALGQQVPQKQLNQGLPVSDPAVFLKEINSSKFHKLAWDNLVMPAINDWKKAKKPQNGSQTHLALQNVMESIERDFSEEVGYKFKIAALEEMNKQ